MNKTRLLSFTSACVIGVMASSANAQTQWIQDTLTDQCSAASQAMVADATRETIEESVARAEASIQAPASVADLSCMNDLLGANLDIFSSGFSGLGSFNIDAVINDVVGGLKSGLSLQTLSTGVERAICDFAAEKFGDLTTGLDGSMDDIVSGTANRPEFTDGFGLLNIGFSSGSVSSPTTTGGGTATAAGSAGSAVGGNTNAAPVAAPPAATAVGPANTTTEQQIQSIWNSISGGN